MVKTVGVLALQGDFHKHVLMLNDLGCNTVEVRYPDQLQNLDGLIVPGGESSTMSMQLDSSGLRPAIIEFAGDKPVMGTCAGLILLARDAGSEKVTGLGIFDLEVGRNQWGRQVHSFIDRVDIHANGQSAAFPAVFIRAPKILQTGPSVEVLATLDGEPVMIRQGQHLGMAFHPELTNDTSIHELFLRAITQ